MEIHDLKKNVAVFPGQGSQVIGMGQDFYSHFTSCRHVFEEASTTLGFDVAKICFNDEEKLNLTEYTQPCILTTEIAMTKGLNERFDFNCQYFGGHSLGEFTALVAAGVIPFTDALEIVHSRGKLMQEAVPIGIGGMAAIMANEINMDKVKSCLAGLSIDIANINSTKQVVISGDKTALLEAEKRCKELFKSSKLFAFVPLHVSAPFHSFFMKRIEKDFFDKLVSHSRSFQIQNVCKVASNYRGTFHTPDENDLILNLVKQLSNPVLWLDNMRNISQLSSEIYEIGPKRTLRDFFKTIGVGCKSICNLADADKILSVYE